MDTLLAIASRRDERRTLPEPLPATDGARTRRGAALGVVQERAAVDVRRADEPGTNRGARARRSVPENVLGAGLVVCGSFAG